MKKNIFFVMLIAPCIVSAGVVDVIPYQQKLGHEFYIYNTMMIQRLQTATSLQHQWDIALEGIDAWLDFFEVIPHPRHILPVSLWENLQQSREILLDTTEALVLKQIENLQPKIQQHP